MTDFWKACFGAALFAMTLARISAALPSYITFPSNVDWVARDSDHFEIMYRRGEDAFAERALRAAERARDTINSFFPTGPDLTYIVLADFIDATNGYALPIPYSHIVIFASPPNALSELSALDDWLYTVILHEYTHIRHIYPAAGVWKPLRSLFGSIVMPNGLLPNFFHEGLAVFDESQFTTGGRMKGSTFNMYRRMAVEDGVWGKDFTTLDRMDGTNVHWPLGTTRYFFGAQMFQELWKRKGPKGIHQWVESSASNWPFLQDRPLREVYGTDYETLWKDIFDKTGEETKREIAAIKATPLSQLTYLTQSRFSKWDVTYSPDASKAAYFFSTPSEGTNLEIVDLRTRKKLKTLKLSSLETPGLCWGRVGKLDYIATLEAVVANNYVTNYLFIYNPRTGRQTRLRAWRSDLLDHLLTMSCSPDLSRFLVYREVGGAASVMELKFDADEKMDKLPVIYREWKPPVGTWPTGLLYGEESWIGLRSATGTALYRWRSTDETPVKVLETRALLSAFRAGDVPGEIFAVANLDGRDEVWRVRPEAGTTAKVIGLLGGTNGFDVRNGRWLVQSYRHGGYDLAFATPVDAAARTIARVPRGGRGKHGRRSVRRVAWRKLPGPIRQTRVTAGRRPQSDPKLSEVHEYSPLGSLYPRSWIPSVLIVPGGAQFGAWIPGFDLSQRHNYEVMGGYDTRGYGFGAATYTYRFGLNSSADVSAFTDPGYYILQTRYGASLGYSTRFGWFPPAIHVAAIAKRNEATVYNNEPILATQSIGGEVTLSYSFDMRSRPLDIAPYRGTKISLSHDQFFKQVGSTNNYLADTISIDQYLEAPWKEGHIFFFSARAGYTYGTDLLTSNFQGGGELLFSQGRGFFLNRGFLPGQFISDRIFNANFEYRFPLFRVDHGLGLWPAFLKNVHAALTSDVTTQSTVSIYKSKRYNDLFNVYYPSVGAELKTEWIFGYYLPAQLRAGVYHGFGPLGQSLYFVMGMEASIL